MTLLANFVIGESGEDLSLAIQAPYLVDDDMGLVGRVPYLNRDNTSSIEQASCHRQYNSGLVD